MKKVLLCALLFLSIASGAGVKVGFDPERPEIGPFPNDFLTVSDSAQKTGRRVAMPLPNCTTNRSDCDELNLINRMDGFNVQARITVRFSGPVNPDTLRDGIYFLWLDTVWPRPYSLGPVGQLTPINRVVYDPATFTAYAKPDDILEQGRRFAIIVTSAVRDTAGDPVERDEGFQACLDQKVGGEYCVMVSRAASLSGRRVAGASVFTTLSVTPYMEGARSALDRLPPRLTRTAPPVELANLASWEIRRQNTVLESLPEQIDVGVTPAVMAAAGVRAIAFGSYPSPKFLGSDQAIPSFPTGDPVPVPASSEEIYFHVWLPATPPPAGGYPILLAGHGLTDDRFGMPTAAALALASKGVAVFAISAVGHGYGPRTALRVTSRAGVNSDIPAPGRTIDVDRNGVYAVTEGCVLLTAENPVFIRDCLRQTALDWMQAIRLLRTGVDLDGDGRVDLDGRSIGWISQSLGSFYGSMVLAVDPLLTAGVLNVGGGSAIEASRLSPLLRLLSTTYLGFRQPSLLNGFFSFDEQYAFRYQPVVILNVPGAAAIQQVFERLEWIEAPGAPVNFAPHWKSATLAGSPIKKIMLQIAAGDQVVPNPANSLLIRGGNSREMTSLYRHDIARTIAPGLPEDPHSHLAWVLDNPGGVIATASLLQAWMFLAGDGSSVPDVNPLVMGTFGRPLFEIPPAALPETNGFRR